MYKYQKTVDALKRAVKAAEAVSDCEDGGLRNLDIPLVYMPKGIRKSTMDKIAKLTGLTFTLLCWEWGYCSQWYVEGAFLKGHGKFRTRKAETFVESLKSDGIHAWVMRRLELVEEKTEQ